MHYDPVYASASKAKMAGQSTKELLAAEARCTGGAVSGAAAEESSAFDVEEAAAPTNGRLVSSVLRREQRRQGTRDDAAAVEGVAEHLSMRLVLHRLTPEAFDQAAGDLCNFVEHIFPLSDRSPDR